MKDAAQASPFENLSNSDKDELIAHLWHDLQLERSRSSQLEQRLAEMASHVAGASDGGSLLSKLRRGSVSTPGMEPDSTRSRSRLGRGLGFLQSKFLLGAALFFALAFVLDFAIGRFQSYQADQKRAAALGLQHAAYEGLYVELVNIAYEPDGKSYRLTMKMSNVEPGGSIYVMQTPVRVFLQSGLAWKEVPARAANGESATVIRLAGAQTYETVFEPNLKEWTELLPGYMHVRLESVSLISQRTDPDDDIVERTDRYYVYLKPHGADDDAIRRRMKYQGQPPLYMPMPPH